MQQLKNKATGIIGLIFCMILLPILIFNAFLVIRYYTEPGWLPEVGGYMPLVVMSGSMKPVFEPGDLVITKTAHKADVKVGDIITFRDPASDRHSVVSHRVIETAEKEGKTYWITKGDANDEQDRNPVSEDDLVGKYIKMIPEIGRIVMFIQTTEGIVACVVLPLLLILILEMVRNRRREKRLMKMIEGTAEDAFKINI